MPPCFTFYVGSGDRTQVLVFVWQALYPLICLPAQQIMFLHEDIEKEGEFGVLGLRQSQLLSSRSSWEFCPKISPCQLTKTCPFPLSPGQGWGHGEIWALLLVLLCH